MPSGLEVQVLSCAPYSMNEKLEKRFANVGKSKTFNNIVDTFDLRNKAVFDIGCAYGEFLAHFGKGSIGVCLEPKEIEYGTKKGLDIRFGNVEDKDFKLDATFDAIFANNILEHLLSPHSFLCEVKKYLKPNGILILGVPCIPKLSFLMRFKKFRGSLARLHINFFTKDTLANTARFAGWDVQTTRGFHIKNAALDHILDPIYPHFYVIARLNPDFAYSEKRLKELEGYRKE